MAQTLEQRRRNAKFLKEQAVRRGKSEAELSLRDKVVHKSPISPIWFGLLGFVIFGGIIFELLMRMFGS